MIRFGRFFLSPGGAHLAASFWRPTTPERLAAARAEGLSIAEIRFDLGRFASLAAARAMRKTVVASRHFCGRVPAAAMLTAAAARALDLGDVGKIAARVESAADLARLRKLAARRLPLAVVGFGESAAAVESRAALPAAGSVLGFARTQGASAPGQMTVAQTARALVRRGMQARF